ncbi:unnamed protein product [Plutella xylostella]|uniref:(diamondback moth) hypothetical protein n=1 Tax=Plutella xylostella TaxID=51655 RepID=A0A8S4FGY1_PLUXY|nr:unnamed protein product [Plutella xylostella]
MADGAPRSCQVEGNTGGRCASETATLGYHSAPPAPPAMQARRHSYWWHLLVDLPILLMGKCILFSVDLD